MAVETAPGDAIWYSYPDGDPNAQWPDGCAYYNGTYTSRDEAKIPMFDFGFSRSDLTYTVAQVWHGRFFRLGDHLDRLLDGAGRMGLASPLSKAELAAVMHEMVIRTGLREAYVNIWISRGIPKPGQRNPRDMSALVGGYAVPYIWASLPMQQVTGKTAVVARTVQRVSPATIDPSIKNFQWGDLTKGMIEAAERGADVAFLLDSDRFVAEGPGFNICLISGGELYTPARGVLHGITRKTVLDICAQFGIPAHVADVPVADLYTADEIFTCTTAGGIMPVRELDGQPVSGGKPGPITTRIRNRYWQLMDEETYTEPVEYRS